MPGAGLIVPGRGASGLPDGLASPLVEGDGVLEVDAVQRQDQQVLEDDRRGRRAAEMTARQVGALPKHLGRAGVEAGRAVAAKVDVDAPRFDDRRRRGVTVHRDRVAEGLRVVAVKHLLVEANRASLGIHADGEEVMAIHRRGGQPDLAAHHDRRGPAAKRNLGLPFDVVRLAPVQRQAREVWCRPGPRHGRCPTARGTPASRRVPAGRPKPGAAATARTAVGAGGGG